MTLSMALIGSSALYGKDKKKDNAAAPEPSVELEEILAEVDAAEAADAEAAEAEADEPTEAEAEAEAEPEPEWRADADAALAEE